MEPRFNIYNKLHACTVIPHSHDNQRVNSKYLNQCNTLQMNFYNENLVQISDLLRTIDSLDQSTKQGL